MGNLSEYFINLPPVFLEKVVVDNKITFQSYQELLNPLGLSFADTFYSVRSYVSKDKNENLVMTLNDFHKFLLEQHINHTFLSDEQDLKKQAKSMIPSECIDLVRFENGFIQLKNRSVLLNITKKSYQTVKKHLDTQRYDALTKSSEQHTRTISLSYKDFINTVNDLTKPRVYVKRSRPSISEDTLLNYLTDENKEWLPVDVYGLPVIKEEGRKLVFIQSFNNLAKLLHKSKQSPINNFLYLDDKEKHNYWKGGKTPIKMPVDVAISYLERTVKGKTGNHSFSVLKNINCDSVQTLGDLVGELWRKDASKDFSWLIDAKYDVSIIKQADESFIFFKSFNNVAMSLSVDPKTAKKKFLQLSSVESYQTKDGLKLPLSVGLDYIKELITTSSRAGSWKSDITNYLNGPVLSSVIKQTNKIVPQLFLDRPIYLNDDGEYFVIAKNTSEISASFGVEKNLIFGLVDFKQYRLHDNALMFPLNDALEIFEKIYNKQNRTKNRIIKKTDNPKVIKGLKTGFEEFIAIKKKHPLASIFYDTNTNTLTIGEINKTGQLESVYLTYTGKSI